MPERFRIIGAARHGIDDEEFRELAREAVEGSGRAARSTPRPGSASPSRCASPASATASRQLGEAIADGARGARRRAPACSTTSRCRRRRRRRRSRRSATLGLGEGARVITEKPFGTDLDSARELNATPALGLRRALHLPHRPLPRPRGGAEPARAALRQRHVRAGLEPQPHRPRPDRRPGDALDRDAGQLLRGNRRLPRHDRHPPLPGARLRRDGAADLAGAEGAGARAREGLRLDAAAAARERRPRPVRAATATRTASPPTPTPRPSSRSRPSSTTGAGRACRSTCARASAWPRAGTC